MTKQDDVLQHYSFKKRGKKFTVSSHENKIGTGSSPSVGGKLLRKKENARLRKILRKWGIEERVDKRKAFKKYTDALVSKGDAATRAKKVKEALEAFREAKNSFDGGYAKTGDQAVEWHLKDLAEAKKANDRSRQQHGEVKVRSYRRNGKIVRGYKRARRSSRGR